MDSPVVPLREPGTMPGDLKTQRQRHTERHGAGGEWVILDT